MSHLLNYRRTQYGVLLSAVDTQFFMYGPIFAGDFVHSINFHFFTEVADVTGANWNLGVRFFSHRPDLTEAAFLTGDSMGGFGLSDGSAFPPTMFDSLDRSHLQMELPINLPGGSQYKYVLLSVSTSQVAVETRGSIVFNVEVARPEHRIRDINKFIKTLEVPDRLSIPPPAPVLSFLR